MRSLLAALALLVVLAIGGTAGAADITMPGTNWNAAYQAAQPGDVIQVPAGTYGSQMILRDADKPVGSAPVTFQPAPGAHVKVEGSLRLGDESSGQPSTAGASDVVVRDIEVTRNVGAYRTSNLRFENIDGGAFYLRGVQNAVLDGGDWGPCLAQSTCWNTKLDVTWGNEQPNQNITIQNARFHDFRIIPGSGAHDECLIIFSAVNVTIKNNTWDHCEFYDIFVQNAAWAGADRDPVRDILFEGNDFGVPCNGTGGEACSRGGALAFSPRGIAFTGMVVKCNKFGSAGISLNDDGDGTSTAGIKVIPMSDPSCQGTPPPPPPPPAAQCADAADNDGDGKVDLSDPGCSDASDNSESPDPTPPPPPPATCDAACEQGYKDQIAALTSERDAAVAAKTQALAERDAAVAARDSAETALARLQDKLDRIAAITDEP